METARVITALLLTLIPISQTHGQRDELLKALEPVDEKQRPRLAERLRLFIEYERTQQWGKLLKLIDKVNAENKNAEGFSKEMSRMGHLDFLPERAEADDHPYDSQYRIYGCVKARADGDVVWFQGGLVAYLQGGDWYFTPYFLSYDRRGRRLLCTHQPRSGKGG